MAKQRRKIEVNNLRKMREYSTTRNCYRQTILKYFGEKAPSKCTRCGNCAPMEQKAAAPTTKKRNLYELLKSVRQDFASNANIPPELVFSDMTLQLMAEKKPKTKAEFMQIPGISPAKYEKYGKVFLRVIQRNCNRKNGA